MYQAIVFLPLLGAILAGIIAIVGARARFPGEWPPPGDDGTGDHTAHGHAPAVGGDAGVIHHSHQESDGHGHAAAAEPAAAGSRTSELITTTLLLISMILSWIAFVQVGFGHHDEHVQIFTWIASGEIKIEWSLRIDTLT